MELTGEYTIDAPRQQVWEALNDPEILKQCIPGCEEIEQTGETEFSAKVKAKVGPVNARFAGTVNLSDLNPPESYTISGEGSGGAAGFAKGSADVRLDEVDAHRTKLSYQVNAQVGGKLAQIGQRLVQSTANKYAKEFFDSFEQVVGQPAEAVTESAAAAPAKGAESPAARAAAAAAGTDAEAAPGSPEPADAVATRAPGTAAGGDRGRDVGTRDDRLILPYPYWIAGVIVVVLVLLALVGL